MKLKLATTLFVLSSVLAPAAAYADKGEPHSATMKQAATDTTITTKVKATYAKDKDVSAMKIHVDTANGVVKLEDGRMYRVQPGTELVFKGYPTPLGALQPGSYITITGAQPVIYQNGQYIRGVQN